MCLWHGRGPVSEVFYGTDREFVGSLGCGSALVGFIDCVAPVGVFRLGVAADGFSKLGVGVAASSCWAALCARSRFMSGQFAWHPLVPSWVLQAGVCVSRVFWLLFVLRRRFGAFFSFFFESVTDSVSYGVCSTIHAEFLWDCQLCSCVFPWWLVSLCLFWFLGSGSRVGGSCRVSRAVDCSVRFTSLVARVVFSLVCELAVLLFRSSVAKRFLMTLSALAPNFQFVVLGLLREGRHVFSWSGVATSSAGVRLWLTPELGASTMAYGWTHVISSSVRTTHTTPHINHSTHTTHTTHRPHT